MAIYSCNLRSIGRTTHDPGTAGAHIRYIGRPDAEPDLMAQHMPRDPIAARTWMDRRERGMRKNARVIDKLRIALPRELTPQQRAELVQAFMQDLTGGRVPWYAGIHQTGKDAHNPHVHIAIHDRDIETGRRLLCLSDNARDRSKASLPGPKAVDWVRKRWEAVCNDTLARWGIAARIDSRTLAAQGIDRTPTIHEGPRAQRIIESVRRPDSRQRVNGCGRVINYPLIDGGRTRREFNAHVIDLNLERASRSGNPVKAAWAQFEKEQLSADRKLEDRLATERRARTSELRLTALHYAARIKVMRAERRLKLRAAAKRTQERYGSQRIALRARHAEERAALKDKQSRLHMRIFALVDITGRTRRRQEAARKTLSATHRAERAELNLRHREAAKHAREILAAGYDRAIEKEQGKRDEHLAQLRSHHEEADRFSDLDRQRREAEREQMRSLTERKIEDWQQRDRLGEQKASGEFAKAILRAAKQEARRPRGPEDGRDRDGPGQ